MCSCCCHPAKGLLGISLDMVVIPTGIIPVTYYPGFTFGLFSKIQNEFDLSFRQVSRHFSKFENDFIRRALGQSRGRKGWFFFIWRRWKEYTVRFRCCMIHFLKCESRLTPLLLKAPLLHKVIPSSMQKTKPRRSWKCFTPAFRATSKLILIVFYT